MTELRSVVIAAAILFAACWTAALPATAGPEPKATDAAHTAETATGEGTATSKADSVPARETETQSSTSIVETQEQEKPAATAAESETGSNVETAKPETDPETTAGAAAAPATQTTKEPLAEQPERTRTLRVASWGGAYGKAQSRAILEPVRTELDIRIERVSIDKDSTQAGNADVLEVDRSSLVKGCRSGAFAPIQPIDLSHGPDGGDGAGDFVADGITDCGVATFAWSALVLFDGENFRGLRPRSLADVFNLKRFPGKRAFPKRMENLLEMLVVSGGTEKADVYAALRDREALDKAYARLEKLLPHITWTESASETVALLERGKVRFALAYSGRAFRKTIAGRLNAIWDGHIYDHGSWVISANARDQELAKTFIALATSPKMLAAQARIWPYGPMRKSAVAMAGRHSLLDVELSQFMPTSQIRLAAGMRRNAEFWLEQGERLNQRLATLMEGFPIGIRPDMPMRRPEPPPPPIPPLPEQAPRNAG